MSYIAEFDLLFDETNDLHKKVARAIDKAARDVIAEDPGTANHAQRLRWAEAMRADVDKIREEAHRVMPLVLDNPTVSSAGNTATDNDVQFVVNSLVDRLAG